jgi:HSP20 family molecular chaperone IbpA
LREKIDGGTDCACSLCCSQKTQSSCHCGEFHSEGGNHVDCQSRSQITRCSSAQLLGFPILARPWGSLFGSPVLASPACLQPRVWSSENGILIDLDRPGLTPQDFEITIEKDRLSVAIKPDAQADADAGDGQYHVHERDGACEPAEFRLPFAIHQDLTDVSYKDGILRISVTRPAEEQPRKLNVRAS